MFFLFRYSISIVNVHVGFKMQRSQMYWIINLTLGSCVNDTVHSLQNVHYLLSYKLPVIKLSYPAPVNMNFHMSP